jgi:hypothetical protein
MAQNLDYFAAKAAKDLLEKVGDSKLLETVSTKAIGVMQNQGIYGLYLYLQSRKTEEKEAKKLWNILEKLARDILGLKSNDVALEIVENREHQMLIFDLFERTLIYMRFSAKAFAKTKG